MILAIDPGSTESAYVLMDKNLKPIELAKLENTELLQYICDGRFDTVKHIAIENVACYGMPVGKEVFDTCIWIGRFYEELLSMTVIEPIFVYRREEKMNLCKTMKAKDSNIIQALKDRFGDKGTKKNPGWFYGFKKDIWQAYAVGATYSDLYLKEDK